LINLSSESATQFTVKTIEVLKTTMKVTCRGGEGRKAQQPNSSLNFQFTYFNKYFNYFYLIKREVSQKGKIDSAINI